MSRYLSVLLIIFVYLIFCFYCWWRFQRRQRAALAAYTVSGSGAPWLVAFASQTGNAMEIAERTAKQLQHANCAVQFLPLNQVTSEHLATCAGALFIVSTCGEGEAPDNGNKFLHRFANHTFKPFNFAVLALGDSSYTQFCAFGHAVQHVLHQQGGAPLCDLIEVDQRDASALRHWQYYLGQLTGDHNFEDWVPATYQTWNLARQECLNPGSPGLPAFHIQLTPHAHTALSWQAGDIAEIGPGNSRERLDTFYAQSELNPGTAIVLEDSVSTVDAMLLRKRLPEFVQSLDSLSSTKLTEYLTAMPDLPHREYSIASLPQDGCIDLVVRQARDTQQRLGLGSGWLTAHRKTGDDILLRVRTNARFHPPVDDVPLILIGNGTGIAGLRALLRARIQQNRAKNWLLFGERTREHDFFFEEEISSWQRSGLVERIDLAFSRDANSQARYVQDLISQQANEIRIWVDNNAAIYVCGSLQGMAQGVDAELETILGRDQLELLAEQGRYCRDVY